MSPRSPHTPVRHRICVWLAACAVLFAAMAPVVSHALALSQGSVALEVEVCTATGSVKLKLEGSAKNDPFHAFKHCSFCMLGGDQLTAPPVPELFLVQLPVTGVADVFSSRVFTAQFVLLAAPRGPPQIS